MFVFFIIHFWTASASLIGNLPFFLVTVITRRCYHCLSTHSFKDCDANRKKVICRSPISTCIKIMVSTTTGGMAYRGCAKRPCLRSGDCSTEPSMKCEKSCCSSDYCNGASGPVVNAVILLIASFTASFMYMFWESERDAQAKPSEEGRTDHIEKHFIVIY